MSANKELFSHFASILPTKNIIESIAYYKDKLGFDINFTWNEPIDYAVLKRGEVSIHLTKRDDNNTPSKIHTALYVFVHDVDKVYSEFQSKGVNITNPLGDREWGMRDFDVKDPEGYILTFGMGIH